MSLLWEQAMNKTSAPPLDSLSAVVVSGKTVLVTGASGGLGLEAARHYVRLGAARVILAVRSQAKGEAAKKEIESNPLAPELRGSSDPSLAVHGPTKRTAIDVWTLDMASFASVQAFANRVMSELDALDIALLNAAVSKDVYEPTQNGWDETLQTNTLSTVLLALLLLPKLRESSRRQRGWTSRLSIVIARAHESVSEDAAWQDAPSCLESLNRPDPQGGIGERYAISKFLLVLGVREIASLVSAGGGEPQVIVTCSCPGACQSDLARDWKTSAKKRVLLSVIQKTIAKTAEEGSRTLVLATLLGPEEHGHWLNKNKIQDFGRNVTSERGTRLQKKIWTEILNVFHRHGVKGSDTAWSTQDGRVGS